MNTLSKYMMVLALGLYLSASSLFALTESELRERSNIICQDEVTLIGLNNATGFAGQKDANKKDGWEISTSKFEAQSGQGAYRIEGTFVIPNNSSPFPLLFFVWLDTYSTTAGDLRLNYRFGLGKPQGERLGIPCKLSE